MDSIPGQTQARRRFLQMLVASPLFACSHSFGSSLTNFLEGNLIPEGEALAGLEASRRSEDVISSPDQAFDVMDFEPAARKALPPAHFGYLATGVDDDGTIRANREGYSRLQIRSRRLVDVETIDMSVRLFEATWSSPIVICPVSSYQRPLANTLYLSHLLDRRCDSRAGRSCVAAVVPHERLGGRTRHGEAGGEGWLPRNCINGGFTRR
jgi:hypothetical protein